METGRWELGAERFFAVGSEWALEAVFGYDLLAQEATSLPSAATGLTIGNHLVIIIIAVGVRLLLARVSHSIPAVIDFILPVALNCLL